MPINHINKNFIPVFFSCLDSVRASFIFTALRLAQCFNPQLRQPFFYMSLRLTPLILENKRPNNSAGRNTKTTGSIDSKIWEGGSQK
jgi:hypothetical protein